MSWGVGSTGWLWMLGPLLFVVGLILVVVWAGQRIGGAGDGEAALSLQMRLARGEIDPAQFEAQRRVVGASERPRARDAIGLIGLVLTAAAVVTWVLGAALAGNVGSASLGMAPGMMGGAYSVDQGGPGSPGFVAGTPTAPRVVRILAGPGYSFSPSDIRIAAGETITFVVTTMGPSVHEFKVGPADEVAADSAAAPEIADIGMMQTRSLTYTFAGSGPFAYACHEPGHYEAGMRGVITVVS